MFDQAASLRKLVENTKEGRETKVVAIVSGKGGVGKTNVSVNLAIGLSQLGKKVLLIDLDLGMANVDIVSGITAKESIADMIETRRSIFDIIADGPEGISIISGGSSLALLFELDPIKYTYFIRQLEQLDKQFDYIFFDMGAGLTNDSLEFILASHEAILIITPEPTSITDSYALMKTIHQHDPQLPFYLLVNACDQEEEGYETAVRFKRVAHQFLRKKIAMIGTLPFDRTVVDSVRNQTPFLLLAPNSKISKHMKKIIYTYSGHDLKQESKPYATFLTKLRNFFLKSPSH